MKVKVSEAVKEMKSEDEVKKLTNREMQSVLALESGSIAD